ncbi:MAG: radical SAM protein [Candidatus Lokiarchaeota archaeon]|nr:radical SAM protein [Candidatus Lokiarchaeota archaeon]
MVLIENLNYFPFFPIKFERNENKYFVKNPITGIHYGLNRDTFRLLNLCDGQHTYSEIISKLNRIYHTKPDRIVSKSKKILNILSDEGIVWSRRTSMKKWQLTPPNTIFWNLTNRCNLSCVHCAVSAGKSNKLELDLDESYQFIDEISKLGVQNIMFTGGEPMIDASKFFKIAEYARSHDLSLQLATNGTLITKRIALMLKKLSINIHISLDGATSMVHDKIRRISGAWEKTRSGIKHLREFDVQFLIATVVTKINIHQIPLIYEFAIKLGAQSFRIIPFIPFGRGRQIIDLEVDPKEMKELCINMRNREKKSKLQIKPMAFECLLYPPLEYSDSEGQIGCKGARHYCTLTSTGEILPCNYFIGVKADNIREHNFNWIWKNSNFLNYFRSLTNSDIQGKCQSCSWLSNCRGGCIAVNFAHKNIFQSNYQCWLNNHE